MSLLGSLSSFFTASGPQSEIHPFSGVGTLLLSDIISAEIRDELPEELATALNKIFALQTECIRDEDGIIIPTGCEVMLAFWKETLRLSHAERALSCGQTILRLFQDLYSDQATPFVVRIALGTGMMTGTMIGGRFQVAGAAFTAEKQLLEAEIPRRSQLLYTSETLQREPSEAVTRIQGQGQCEIPVFEFVA